MSSNKSNKKSKLFGLKSSVFLFLVLVTIGWLAGTFYIAEQTENKVRASLAQQKYQSGQTFFLELISYKRSIFSAQVATRLRSKDKKLNDAVSEIVLRADIKHGPLLFNEHNLQLATASLDVSVDLSQLSEDAKILVTRLFGDKQPFSAKIFVDYELSRFYHLETAPFVYQVADMKLKVSEGSAEGVYKADVNAIAINFAMDEIIFNQAGNSLESMRNDFVFSLLNPANDKTNNEQKLTSAIAMTRDVSYTGMSVNLGNVKLNELFKLIDQYENRYNLDQQIEWTLEDAAQNQEGQDQLLDLFRKQDDDVLPKADHLVSQLLKKGTEDISYIRKVDLHNSAIAYNSSTK